MAKIQNVDNSKCQWEYEVIGTLITVGAEMENDAATLESSLCVCVCVCVCAL